MADVTAQQSVGGAAVPPPKSTPVSQMTNEEYMAELNTHRGSSPDAPIAADSPTPVVGFWHRLLFGVPGTTRLGEAGRSVMRGLAGAGNAVGNAAFNAATSLGGVIDRKTGLGEAMQPGFNAAYDAAGGGAALSDARSAAVVSPQEMEAAYGIKSDDPIASFIESTVQFLSGMALARGLGVTNPVVQGAVSSAVAFDPYEPQLAELMAKAPKFTGVHELGQLLSVHGDDRQIVARFKQAATGVIGGAIADGLIAGVRRIRFSRILGNPSSTAAERAVAEQGITQADEVLQNVADATHTAEGDIVIVRPTGNGGKYTLAINTPEELAAARERLAAITPQGDVPAVLPPDFDILGSEARQLSLLKNPTSEQTARLATIRTELQAQMRANPLPAPAQTNAAIPSEGITTIRTDAEQQALIDRVLAGETRTANRRIAAGQPPLGGLERRVTNRRQTFVAAEAPVSSSSRAEMETLAAEMNAGLHERFSAAKGITPAQAEEHFQTAKAMLAAQTPEEIAARAESANFNLSYYTAQPEVMAQVEAISKQFRRAMDEAQGRPGGVPVEESIRIARQAIGGMTEREAPAIIRAKLKTTEDLHAWLLAGDMIMRDMGKKLARMSEILDARPNDLIAHGEARAALEQFYSTTESLAGANSEVGRSLRILQERDVAAGKVIKYKKPGVSTTPVPAEAPVSNEPRFTAGMTHRDIAAQARMIRMANGLPRNVFAVVHAAQVIKHDGKMAAVLEIFTNFLLSGPRTVQTVVATGGMLNIFEPAVRIAAGAVTGNRVLMREGADIMWGNFKYFGDNLQAAAASLRAGRSLLNPQAQHVAIGGLSGEVIRVPGRVLGAADEFSRVTAYRAYVRAKSLRLGRQQGLTGPALEARVGEDLRAAFDANTGIATLPEALKYAEVPTMSAPLEQGGFGKGFQEFVNNHLEAKFIAPFVKSSANIFNYVHKSIPILNLMNRDVRAALARGGEEASVIHTRSAMASLIYGYGLYQASGGNLVGRGPSDPELRKLWLKNHQPYSIKIGDQWINYARLDPLSTPLGLIADVHTIVNELDAKSTDAEDMAYATVASVFYNLASKSYIQGITEFMSAWASNDPHATQRWIQNMGASLTVPALVSSTNPDPVSRDVQGMADAIIARIPGWSKTLDPKFDIFGEPVLKTPGLLNRNQIFTAKDVQRGVEDDLLDIGKGLSPLAPKIEGGLINLKDKTAFAADPKQPSPYIRMTELIRNPADGGPSLRDAMTELVRSPQWQESSDGTSLMPGGKRWILASALKTKYEMRALKQVMDEYPKLRNQIQGVRRIRGAAISGGEQGVQDIEQLFGVTAK